MKTSLAPGSGAISMGPPPALDQSLDQQLILGDTPLDRGLPGYCAALAMSLTVAVHPQPTIWRIPRDADDPGPDPSDARHPGSAQQRSTCVEQAHLGPDEDHRMSSAGRSRGTRCEVADDVDQHLCGRSGHAEAS